MKKQSPILKAKKTVLNYSYPKSFFERACELKHIYTGFYTHPIDTLNPLLLAQSLGYFIAIDEKESSEKRIPIGRSKKMGLPHLPKSWEWPANQCFYAQLNFADFKLFDIENVLPDKGILYLFDNGNADNFLSVHYYNGPLEELEIRKYPEALSYSEEGGYTIEDYQEQTYSYKFMPKSIFYVGGDAYEHKDIYQLIPAGLKKELKEILQCKLTDWSPSTRIFGKPIYWQGENEYYSKTGEPYKVSEDLEDKEDILLFQDEIGDGHFHVWIDRDDLTAKRFEKAYVSYSGT